MKLEEFQIGRDFMMGEGRWRCTDIGTRTVAAIRLNMNGDPRWYNGPPYAVEMLLDECDLPRCKQALEPVEPVATPAIVERTFL